MIIRLALILTIVLLANTAYAMNGNFFDQGIQLRVECLLNIFDPAIKVFKTCSENLKENPTLEDFQTNFNVINTAYKTLYKKIQEDQTLLFEFMDLKDSAEIKEKIKIIKNYFDSFQGIILVNTPKYSLLNYADQKEEALKHIMNVFIKNKCHCDSLALENMQRVASLFERKQEVFDGVEIVVEHGTADDEKLAQQLQLKLNLELMYEREAQERSARDEHHTNENSLDEQAVEIIECLPAEEVLPECPSAQQRGASIFSGATNDAQFIAGLKEIIYGVDITKEFDAGLFNKFTARAPNSFSMVMNREIGRASAYDVMHHNFNERPMTSYACYFPECLMVSDDEGAAVQVRTLEGHASWVSCIKYLDDGRLASGSSDGTIKVWNLNDNRCVATLEGHASWVSCIKYLDDGRLASCSNDGTIKVWNLNDNRCVARFEGHTGWIYCIKQLTDGRWASGSDDKTIKVWDLDINRCVATLEGHAESINCIKQLNDGRLASGSSDGMIKLWDLNTNKCVVTLEGHKYFISCIKQLDDERLASGSSNGMIKLWDLNTNKCIATLEGHKYFISCIKQLDDERLASGSSTGMIKLWDLNTNKCIATLEGHTGWIRSMKLLNGGRLASGSSDGMIKLWDLNTNKCIATLEGHTHPINCIKQLDDSRFASCSNDQTIKIWYLYPDLSFEQIALVVYLERCRQQGKIVGDGWHKVWETLPDYFQKCFKSVIR